MAKAQTVADLKINLKADLGNLEFLRKDLKQISKESKLADKSFEGLVAEIKNLGKATEKTTYGLKGQIAAFEKLRDRAAFQGKAYKDLTREIVNMNKALVNRLDIERKLGTEGNKGVRTPGADVTSGLLASSYFTNSSRRKTGTQAEFADRISKLQMLMYARTFESLTDRQQEFLEGIKTTTKGYLDQRYLKDSLFSSEELARDKARALKHWDEKGKYTKTPVSPLYDMSKFTQPGALNELQLKALGLESSALDVKSKDYLEVLTKITAEEGHQSKILSQQELRSRADIANKKARTIATNKLADAQIRFNQSEGYQLYKGALRTKPPTEGLTKDFAPQNMDAKLPKLRKFLEQPQWVRKLQGFLDFGMGLKSRQYKDVEAELGTGDFFAKYKRTQRGGIGDIYRPESLASFLRQKTGRKDDSYEQLLGGKGDKAVISTGGAKRQIDAMIARQGKVKREDFFGLGPDLGYPMTPRGQQSLIGDLQDTLLDLTPGTENYKTVKEELTRVTERWLKVNEKANKSLKDAQKEYAGLSKKALPAAGQTGKKGGALVAYDSKFAKQQSQGLQQTVESLDQYLDRVRKGTKAQNLNINSLTKQRSKLDEIRNGLDPTTVAFKKATQAISTTDKALSRLNNNKFSGKNLLRTGQAILGATYFGGVGGGVGAAIGGLFGGQGGAVTGGLVGSQIAQPVSQFVGGSTTYASDIAKSQIALTKATQVKGEDGFVDQAASAQSLAIAMQTAKRAVEDFNVPQDLAMRGMTRLSAAVIGAGGNVHNAARAFYNITAAIKGTAGGVEDTKAAITAMVQIYSKGKVSAEELSGQLGERFPAAVTKFQLANQEIYPTTAALQKALKDGTVGLAQLEKFLILLGDEFVGTAKKIGASSEEAGERAKRAMESARLAIGRQLKELGAAFQVIGEEVITELVPALIDMATGFAEMVKAILPAVNLLAKSFVFLIKNFHTIASVVAVSGGVMAGLAAKFLVAKLAVDGFRLVLTSLKLRFVYKGFIALVGALKALTIAQWKANVAALANPYVALAAGVTAATIALYRMATAHDRMVAKLEAGQGGEKGIKAAQKQTIKYRNSIEKLRLEIKKLEGQKSLNSIEIKDLAEKKAQIEDYKNKIKEITEAIESFREAVASGTPWADAAAKLFEALESLSKGKSSPLESLAQDLKEVGKGVEQFYVNTFKKMEDALTNFVMTGKLNFKEFARSIIADITRMFVRYTILAPLFGGLKLPGFGTGTKSLPREAKGGVYSNGIRKFAYGGVVNKPTLFPFAKGVGLMGEAGPEAIIPLQRGKNGKLGVAGGGGTTTVNVSVDAKGTKVEGDGKQMAQLGKMLGSAIEAELIKQKRPGGLLAN